MDQALKDIAPILPLRIDPNHEAENAPRANWPEMTAEFSRQVRNLRSGPSEVMKAFSGVAQTALAAKALDVKTKELIAIAIAIAVRCDDCIAFHVKAAIEQGASREEVTETLGMAIYMGAGPSVMYASHALEAIHSSPAETASLRSSLWSKADARSRAVVRSSRTALTTGENTFVGDKSWIEH